MPRPIKATIHMGSLRHNVRQMKSMIGNRDLWAVAKAEAYGHGLERAVRAFEEADGLALIDIADIERARVAGWRKRILMLQGPFTVDDLDTIEAMDAEAVIHNDACIAMLREKAPFTNIKVHIKLF